MLPPAPLRTAPATLAHREGRSSDPVRAALLAVAASWLAGCAYKPGSFTHQRRHFTGVMTTVGCLDLALHRRVDKDGSAVMSYQFGNRCDRPATVDLAFAAVIGRTSDGIEHRLAPFDPEHALVARELDGRYAGGEALAYPADQPLVQVCVDVASIAQQTPARWQCFGRVDRDGAPFNGHEIVRAEVTQ